MGRYDGRPSHSTGDRAAGAAAVPTQPITGPRDARLHVPLKPWPLSDPVLIAGGGIGGLATALALAQRGIPSRVLERRTAFSEDGAGIQLGPNATRILIDLGCAEALEPFIGVPETLEVREGATGRPLASLPLGLWIARRHGAPYWVAHRRDLHRALLQTAEASPLVGIETGASITAWAPERHGIAVHLDNGGPRWGVTLIAADGLWSSLRAEISAEPPAFAGKRAVRTVIAADAAPAALRRSATFAWLSPKAHVVHYPIRGGAEIAVVGIFDETAAEQDWSAPADAIEVNRRVARFAEPVRALFAAAENTWRCWALHTLPPLPRWTCDRMALLGDAAHPMLPFFAQGGAMALEDAETLAACLARIETTRDLPSALARYQAARAHRVRHVQEASRRNGEIYHLAGPMAAARNLTMRLVPGSRLMARYDWLYGWRSSD